MKPESQFDIREANIIPAILEPARAEGLKLDKLTAGVPVDEHRKWACTNRHEVGVTDGTKACIWKVESLRELFRGDHQPPPNIERYPPEYVPLFFAIENQLLPFCDVLGDKSDQEFEEVFTNLRKRPDGRSLGPLHDFVWQLSAVMLGTRVVSQAEFEAVVGQLGRSARRWAQRPISRNYIAYLRNTFE